VEWWGQLPGPAPPALTHPMTQDFGDEALGTGTEVGPNLSLLAGQVIRDSGDSGFPDSEGGHQGLKTSHRSGLAPCAADPRLVCLLDQASPCCRWGPGKPPQ